MSVKEMQGVLISQPCSDLIKRHKHDNSLSVVQPILILFLLWPKPRILICNTPVNFDTTNMTLTIVHKIASMRLLFSVSEYILTNGQKRLIDFNSCPLLDTH